MFELGKVSFKQVEKELRGRSFAILGTISRDYRPHSTGVVYSVSARTDPLAFYVTTRTNNKKVRNIRANPNVSLVVPLSRRLLSFIPPYCIQFQGTASILEASNEEAIHVFESSRILRMILKTEFAIVAKAGGDPCFIRISPDPTIFTYGLGTPVWRLSSSAGAAMSKVTIPMERLVQHPSETSSVTED